MRKLPILLFVIASVIVNISFAQKQGKELYDSLILELPKAKEDTFKANLLLSLSLSLDLGESDRKLQYANDALVLSKKLNFQTGIGKSYSFLGDLYADNGDYEEALRNYKMAKEIWGKMGDKSGVASIINNMAIVYASRARIDDAFEMYFEAVKLNQQSGNKEWLANNYNNIGLLYQNQSNYPEALKMLYAALKIYEETGNIDQAASAYNNIGILYWTQKEYNEALQIYFKALKMIARTGDSIKMHHPYNNMAGIYADMGNYPEALKSYEISLRFREKIGDKNLIGDSYAGFGVVYQRMGNYSEALKKFNEVLKYYSATDNRFGLAGIYASFGEINFALKDFEKAKTFFDKSLPLYKESSDPSQWYYIYEDLAKLDSATGKYKSALQNYKTYVSYRDSTINQDNTKKLVQTQMQYDFDKKDAATKAEQEKKDVLTAANMKRQRTLRNAFIAGFTFMLLFAGIFFMQRNKIKKGKKRSDELLLNILPAETAEELKATGTAAAKDFDEVTVLFTDFKDFTQASEKMLAHEVVNEIHYYFSEFDRIISKYSIEKIKTIGDSYMAAGGLPVANKTNPEDTVNAALEMQSFMQRIKEERIKEGKSFFEMRIGVHTGPVVAGIVGIKKFAYDIWGDTVNIAARMESTCEVEKVNISGTTYELVKDKFNCIYRGKIQAKHKGEIDMYFVNRNFNEG